MWSRGGPLATMGSIFVEIRLAVAEIWASASRLWGGGGFSAATSLFSLLGALRKGSEKKYLD